MVDGMYREVHIDYYDEISGVWCVDAWKTNSDDEEGVVVAKINPETFAIQYTTEDEMWKSREFWNAFLKFMKTQVQINTAMDKKSELDCYLFFMWNEWCKEESIAIFGETLGNHIWGKWMRKCELCGADGAPASIYSELDVKNRRKIVERAVNYYNS